MVDFAHCSMSGHRGVNISVGILFNRIVLTANFHVILGYPAIPRFYFCACSEVEPLMTVITDAGKVL